MTDQMFDPNNMPTIKPAKVKKTKSTAQPGDKRLKANRPEPTEAQKAARFQPGNAAAKDAWTMKSETRAFRKQCHEIILHGGTIPMVQMIVHCANNGMFKEYMELNRFLAEYAYGKPREMKDVDDDAGQTETQKFNFLQITQTQFDEASESDVRFQ